MGHEVWRARCRDGDLMPCGLIVDFRSADIAEVPQCGNKANREEEKYGKAGDNAPDATPFSPGVPSKAIDDQPDGNAHNQHAGQHVGGNNVDGIAGEIHV